MEVVSSVVVGNGSGCVQGGAVWCGGWVNQEGGVGLVVASLGLMHFVCCVLWTRGFRLQTADACCLICATAGWRHCKHRQPSLELFQTVRVWSVTSFTNVGIASVGGGIILILMDRHFIVSTTDSMSPSLQSSLCTTIHACQIGPYLGTAVTGQMAKQWCHSRGWGLGVGRLRQREHGYKQRMSVHVVHVVGLLEAPKVGVWLCVRRMEST